MHKSVLFHHGKHTRLFRKYTSQKQNLVKLEQLNWVLAMLFKKTSVHCGVLGPAALGLGDTECLLFIHAPCINKRPLKLTLPDSVTMRKSCFLNEKETKHGSKFYCRRSGSKDDVKVLFCNEAVCMVGLVFCSGCHFDNRHWRGNPTCQARLNSVNMFHLITGLY